MRALLVAALAMQVLAGQDIRLAQVASGVTAPTDIQHAGDGSGRLFFVQQNGLIRMFRNGALAAQPFLDIRAKTRLDSERGLLGLAFPPGFDRKQRFYVNYTDLDGNTVIAQYRVSTNADLADAASETVLLHITQPFANHNGGQLRFGPDGYLYIGMGDGGSAGDPMRNSQNLGSLLGKMLRIDPRKTATRSYSIPPDNPYVGTTNRKEIFAYGFRNPWRFTFEGNLIVIADVGQSSFEEINYLNLADAKGANFGWPDWEGRQPFDSPDVPPGPDPPTFPMLVYNHNNNRCAVIGGYVSHDPAISALSGRYLYGDLCDGKIRSMVPHVATQKATDIRLVGITAPNLSSFGRGPDSRLYITQTTGELSRIEPPSP
jgi:glucose/arabinose dehydrogenase